MAENENHDETTQTSSGAGTEDPVNEFLDLQTWPFYYAAAREVGNGSGGGAAASASSSTEPPPPAPSSQLYFVGFVLTHVTDIRYFNGTVNGRETVELVRDPSFALDQNAIKVMNLWSDQIGFIDASAAGILAPMMDSQLISVTGMVPKVSSTANTYRPCQVHIFARPEAFDAVKSAISHGGYQLFSETSSAFASSQAAVTNRKIDGQDEKSVDEIFKLLDEQIGQSGALGELEPPRYVIKSELLSHQKEGLAWLVHRENSCELPPFWELKDGAYYNVLTGQLISERPEPQQGGIFADDMGLGKTLTLLSLIAFDKFCSDSSLSVDTINAANGSSMTEEETITIHHGITKWERTRSRSINPDKRQRRRDKEVPESRGKSSRDSDISTDVCSRTTLVVCPPSVFSSWVSQLKEHTVPGKLKVYMYYGKRTEDVDELCAYDIVLTTYNTLAAEDAWEESPVKKIEWRRVILDEGHLIKNVKARQTKAVTKLKSKRRWVVTGTPIQNSSDDLFSLLSFLKFEPLSIRSCWISLITGPLASGDKKGISWLQVLLATIALRRTKDKTLIGLPSKSVETLLIDLSREERDVYDKMESEARNIIKEYVSGLNLDTNYSTVMSIIVRLRQLCDSLALCPPDFRELLPSLEDVRNNPKLLEKMLSVLQEGVDLDCSICMSELTSPVITCCAHIFCRACILKAIRRLAASCPLCRHPLSDSDLFSAPKIFEAEDALGSSFSSKIAVLLKQLCETRERSAMTKSVVFSQFQKMLLLVEEPLKSAGFKILRLDGSMSANKRAKIIKEFQIPAPDGATILLATLKACGSGINLTAASRLYLLEPWWNPAIEEQAMDRVHRIGQKEDVQITRLIARNTIEERILRLQEEKKLLARKAFGKREGQNEISREDVAALMLMTKRRALWCENASIPVAYDDLYQVITSANEDATNKIRMK